jgi:putative membrane protein
MVMETKLEPFLVLETETAPRLEALPAVVPVAEAPKPRLPLALVGATVLGLGLPALWIVWLITSLFDRSNALGWSGVAIGVIGFGAFGLGIIRELRGLRALKRVEGLRTELASGETARVAAAATKWVGSLPKHDNMAAAINAAPAPDSILSLLRAGPGQDMREAVDRLGRVAAFQTAAIVAATPSPTLDALTVGWRGVRLIREVAAAHGMRPGLLGTLVLLQRTALSAATVAGTELAVNAAAHAVISHPLLRHLVGEVAGAGVAARRMIVLARAAGVACSPIPPA